MMQYLRSILFNVQMYVAMVVLAVLYFPWALFSPAGALAACHTYCAWVLWTLRWIVGLRVEVRGTPPVTEALVAAKHQSFLDILAIFHAVPRGKFIMKHILMFTPIFGQYVLRIGCVPVNRGKRGAAIAKMLDDVQSGKQAGGQLIIYPQGTRLAPGDSAPYKKGTGALYGQLGQPCYPVATNIGLFWPRHGLLRKPGIAVVEFLPPIAPGLETGAFMATLEAQIEGASNALMAEAGFKGTAE